jgi:hypothetical protein
MPRPLVNEEPMTGAERQARYRAARAAGASVIGVRRPADRRSRIQRWNDTIAAAVDLQARVCPSWLGLAAGQPTGQCARRRFAGDCRTRSLRTPGGRAAAGASGVIEQWDGPYGMGHDDARGWTGVRRSSP